MSRINAIGFFNDQDVKLVVGWDRPLKYCFFQFDLTPAQEKTKGFDSLVELQGNYAFEPLSAEDVQSVLSAAGVSVPSNVFEQLKDDVEANAGNVITVFDREGTKQNTHQFD